MSITIKLMVKILMMLLVIAHVNVDASSSKSQGSNISKKEFLSLSFPDYKAKQKTIWLKKDLQKKVITILDHSYPKLRLRYWINTSNKHTVWFLDEIGKERPISFAVSIVNRHISLIKVLAFRESRGGEIQMSSFSKQFENIGLNQDNKLDQHIDGISGATLSVTAMKKISRLALVLDREVLP